MKVLMDKQMNQLEYVETAEDMIKALEDSKIHGESERDERKDRGSE